MKKIIAFCSMLLALCAGATNITNYPVRTTFSSAYWFLLSDVAMQTNWNLPGNYVASTTDLNSASNTLYNIITNLLPVTNFNTILVTNPITNLSLTANTVIKADANKALASIANGTGALTNNNAGLFGWYAYFASFTDLTNLSNSIYTLVTNLTATTNLVVTNFASITVTNPITNLSLTANTVVKADGNKALASIANGTGALTNNNSGTFGWFTYASLQDITNTVQSYTNNLMSSTNTIFTNATVLVNQMDYLTNAAGGMVTVDFAKGYQACTTNNAFTFNLPLNLDSTLKRVQTAVIRVDNSSGPTPIAVTPCANVHVVPGSVMWITNSTYFTWSFYAPDQTNLYAVPIY